MAGITNVNCELQGCRFHNQPATVNRSPLSSAVSLCFCFSDFSAQMVICAAREYPRSVLTQTGLPIRFFPNSPAKGLRRFRPHPSPFNDVRTTPAGDRNTE